MQNSGPIFIVGCPRSGTTLTRSIINAHPNIACGAETHFLKDLSKIVDQHWERIERYDFTKDYWNEKIADFFDTFKSEYAQKQGKKRWAEKTPSYAFKLDFIHTLYPDLQIVHVIRNGYDVTLSHLDRWGYKKAVNSTKVWAESIKHVRDFGQSLPNDQYFEIRYEDLVKEPEENCKLLFEYLTEPWDPIVLEKGCYTSNLTESRRKESGETSALYQSRVGLGKKKLDPLLGMLLNFRSGGLLKQLGY
ncbi:sulfotransferase family protein [Leptothoe spongobia]|uniref:Sulfotransferase n=1 Tax=Leptothoe spongobia TAU-MAC 1115 TaxID=1967444 RepID=A0A947DF41_9CYAN|nr:sulfotransferase [Leptothoe spongobia]MBT9314751.1 sulfotransferase [Leptothoe spongobia TAU-MAC 1115]